MEKMFILIRKYKLEHIILLCFFVAAHPVGKSIKGLLISSVGKVVRSGEAVAGGDVS